MSEFKLRTHVFGWLVALAASGWLLNGGTESLTAQTKPAAKSKAMTKPSAKAARTAPTVVQDRKTFEEHVRPFFTSHCVKCHGEKKGEAKLRLDTLAADFLNRPASDQWVEVLNRINLGE